MRSFSSRSRFHALPNRLTQALIGVRAEGRRVLDLTESNPTRAGLSPAADVLLPLLSDHGVADYAPEPFGLLAARRAIAAELGFGVTPERVMLTASTSEAYSYLLRLLCDPGDSILVPAPSYPLFDVLAQLEQVKLVPYALAYDGEWHLDPGALQAARTPNTRAVVMVHPNNPTGSFMKRDELQALASLGLPIISDEVFADYALGDAPRRVRSALEASDRTLVFRLGGLSKACALPQLKLAWTSIAGPSAEQACARLEHIADAYLSPGAQVQHALPRLLSQGARTRSAILARVRRNLACLSAALADSACSVLRVEGGWYAVVRLPAVHDDESWALQLLREDQVLVQPGYYYELHRGAHLVVSLIVEEQAFAQGVDRLAHRVRATLEWSSQ